MAERAEAAGFDAVLASCHYFNRDPFFALARIADATEALLLGPGVVNPYDAHPVGLASRAATLQEESGGRAVFGIGAGDASTLRALGIDRERPLRRVLESLGIARELWAGEAVERNGVVSVQGARLNYEVEPLPVYVGAQGPDMLRMAAKYADGTLYNAAHPRDVSWASERIEEGLAERPEDRGDFEFVVQASASVAPDESAARETARQAAAVIAAGAPGPARGRRPRPDRENSIYARCVSIYLLGAYRVLRRGSSSTTNAATSRRMPGCSVRSTRSRRRAVGRKHSTSSTKRSMSSCSTGRCPVSTVTRWHRRSATGRSTAGSFS
jgi:5,10-methylenetetrahydromethanopterin reductase